MTNFEILVIYEAKSALDKELFIKKMIESGTLNAIKNEDGCIKYEYHVSNENEKAILLYEIWQSPEHQRVHMQTPHMKTAMEIKQEQIESVTLRKLADF